jgi:hypothetical protein
VLVVVWWGPWWCAAVSAVSGSACLCRVARADLCVVCGLCFDEGGAGWGNSKGKACKQHEISLSFIEMARALRFTKFLNSDLSAVDGFFCNGHTNIWKHANCDTTLRLLLHKEI